MREVPTQLCEMYNNILHVPPLYPPFDAPPS